METKEDPTRGMISFFGRKTFVTLSLEVTVIHDCKILCVNMNADEQTPRILMATSIS